MALFGGLDGVNNDYQEREKQSILGKVTILNQDELLTDTFLNGYIEYRGDVGNETELTMVMKRDKQRENWL